MARKNRGLREEILKEGGYTSTCKRKNEEEKKAKKKKKTKKDLVSLRPSMSGNRH